MTARIIDNSGADKIFVDLMYKGPKESLEEFKNGLKTRIVLRKLEVVEVNPPQDGIAYSSKDFTHVSMSEGRGGFFEFERYWDKDGNPIGFGYKGQKYMFDKEGLPDQGRDNVGQRFGNGQNHILSKVPENSELAKYLEQYPDAKLRRGSNGSWSTELPRGRYPDLWLPAQRIRLWNKDGSPGPSIKGMQKEM